MCGVFRLTLMYVVLAAVCIQIAVSCPVSRECNCSADRNAEIICDIGKRGLPTFSGPDSGEPYKTVVVTGSKAVTDFLFYGLRVEGVVFKQTDIFYVPCHVFSGLEADLKHIDISGNVLETVPSCALIGLKAVTHLNLGNNMISAITDDSFAGLPALVHLDLSRNVIAKVSPMGFHGLDNLVMLNLSGNALVDADKDLLNGLGRLEYLDLSSNGLVRVHEDVLLKSQSLRGLDMSNNSLVMFTMRHLGNLRFLSLRQNQLHRLFGYVFKECTSVEVLDLSVNMMSHFPSFIASLPSLRHFSMADNHLTDLDLQEVSKKKIPFSHINFSSNKLAYVTNVYLRADGDFELILHGNKLVSSGNITVLTAEGKTSSVTIDLSSNLLKVSPRIRYQINHHGDNRMTLNLSDNEINTFKNAQPEVFSDVPISLSNVEISYDLSQNRLKVFPECDFFLLYNVGLLDLSSNMLTELPVGGCFGSSVKELLLSDNKLSRLNKIYFGGVHRDHPILRRIDLARNRITAVANNAFDDLSHSLRRVDLRYNLLESLPKAALSLDSLASLYLQGNPLVCDCKDSIHTAIFNWTLLVDNSRCAKPKEERGFLFKCYWQNCTRYGPRPMACSTDSYLEMQAELGDLAKGFNVSWTTFGPGKITSFRLNVTEAGRVSPTFVHLIHPQVRSYSVVNLKEGRNYSVCLDAVSNENLILASSCFYGLKVFNKLVGLEKSTPVNHHRTGLIVLCVVMVGFVCFLFLYYFRRRQKRQSNLPQRARAWSCNHSDCLVNRMLFCVKGSSYRYDNPSDSPVVMADLLLNEQYSHSRTDERQNDPSAEPSPPEQPPLPPRNSSLRDSAKTRPTDSDNEPTLHPKRKPPKTDDSSGAKTTPDSPSNDKKNPTKKSTPENVYETGFKLHVRLDENKISEEHEPGSSCEENIYEDTFPLDCPIEHTDASFGHQQSPLVIPKRPSVPQRTPKGKHNETNAQSHISTPYSSAGYECPIVRHSQADPTRTTDVSQRNVPATLSNPTYSRMIRKLSSDSDQE